MTEETEKPILDASALGALVWQNLTSARVLLGAVAGKGKIPPRTREVLMLAVTRANDCRWCREAHTILGRYAGIGEAQICRLKLGETAGFTEEEKALVRFGGRFARSGARLSRQEAQHHLEPHFGKAHVDRLLALARLIHTANLTGNTFDHLLFGHLLGRKRAAGETLGRLPGELLISCLFLGVLPIALPVFGLVGLLTTLGFREPEAKHRAG